MKNAAAIVRPGLADAQAWRAEYREARREQPSTLRWFKRDGWQSAVVQAFPFRWGPLFRALQDARTRGLIRS